MRDSVYICDNCIYVYMQCIIHMYVVHYTYTLTCMYICQCGFTALMGTCIYIPTCILYVYKCTCSIYVYVYTCMMDVYKCICICIYMYIQCGFTALMAACGQGASYDVVKLMIERGADVSYSYVSLLYCYIYYSLCMYIIILPPVMGDRFVRSICVCMFICMYLYLLFCHIGLNTGYTCIYKTVLLYIYYIYLHL